MTTVAAAFKDGVYALASDGMISCGSEIQSNRQAKLIKHGEAVIGWSGAVEAREIVEAMTPKSNAKDFAHSVLLLMKEGDWEVIKEEGNAPCYGGSFLYLSTEGVWRVYGRMSVCKMDDDHPLAIGNGCEYAIGAMESLLSIQSDVTTAAIVVHGIRIAMKRDAGTGGSIMLALRGVITWGPEWL